MGLFSRRKPATVEHYPTVTPPDTTGHPPLSSVDAGRHDLLGHVPVYTNAQDGSDLHPYQGVVDRPLFGGVRTAPTTGQFVDGPDFDGQHDVMHRAARRTIVLRSDEAYPADPHEVIPSLRVPPVADPLGRMCANIAARNGGAS